MADLQVEAERAELRHVAEQALYHSPMTGEWMLFHGKATPGVVLQLLDALEASEFSYAQGYEDGETEMIQTWKEQSARELEVDDE